MSLQKVGKRTFVLSPQIANMQILELILLSQIIKFLKCAELQTANAKFFNRLSANCQSENFFGVPVGKFLPEDSEEGHLFSLVPCCTLHDKLA